MSSDPMVKQRITDRLRQLGGSVTAGDFPELIVELGLTDVSITQCKKAIGSLAHSQRNPQLIKVTRTNLWEGRDSHIMGDRPITLTLR